MSRFVLSLFGGLALGLAAGLYLGWVQFPVEYVNSPAPNLAQQYKDDYTIMIAKGFLVDGDLPGAVSRINMLRVDNVPEYVQNTTERYITNSRAIDDIYALIALSEAMGRLTPLMQEYREIIAPEGSSAGGAG
jgi:hypothetical protein